MRRFLVIGVIAGCIVGFVDGRALALGGAKGLSRESLHTEGRSTYIEATRDGSAFERQVANRVLQLVSERVNGPVERVATPGSSPYVGRLGFKGPGFIRQSTHEGSGFYVFKVRVPFEARQVTVSVEVSANQGRDKWYESKQPDIKLTHISP